MFFSVDSDFQWIKDSPRVTGDAVSADLVIGSSFCSVTCSVTGLPPQDCELAHRVCDFHVYRLSEILSFCIQTTVIRVHTTKYKMVCSNTEQSVASHYVFLTQGLSGSVEFSELENSAAGEPLVFTVNGTLYTGVTVVLTREFRIGIAMMLMLMPPTKTH